MNAPTYSELTELVSVLNAIQVQPRWPPLRFGRSVLRA